MKNILAKDTFRDIKKSLGRFLSILAIVALGAAFFAGIKITPIVMRTMTDEYYDKYNLMDTRIVSTLGISKDDVEAVKKIEGVEKVYPSYSADVLFHYLDNEEAFRVHSIPISKDSIENSSSNNSETSIDNSTEGSSKSNSNKDANYINKVKVLEGRLPQKQGECVIGQLSYAGSDFKIGTILKIASSNEEDTKDTFKSDEYKIVGIVQTPYYMAESNHLETNIGSGNLFAYLMIPESDFKSDVYTDMFLTIKGAKQEDSYSDDYFDVVDNVNDKITAISDSRESLRYEEVINEANAKLNDSKKEFEDKKKEVNDKLEKSKTELEKYEKQLSDGQSELDSKKRSTAEQIKNGKEKLEQAEKELKQGYEKYYSAKEEFDSQKSLAQSSIDSAKSELQNAKEGIDNLELSLVQLERSLENTELS
ncbi:MAG: ABC transporter permease, partial [Clostridioides sp.]|nr:ABC transporter permease [Clostridioides sp.]